MKIFPAIDILGGKVVRLHRGEYSESTVYGEDAVSLAKRFRDEGARFLHLVDLDGAKDGCPRNFGLVERLIAATDMFCEVGGGIRSKADIAACLDAGAKRVILGTSALKDPALLEAAVGTYGERIAVAVDVRGGKVALSGWTEDSDTDGVAFCEQLRGVGVRQVIYTDIARDGTLSGIDTRIYERLSLIEGLKVTASGGISSISEIVGLQKLGVDSAVIGKALYEKKLNLPEIFRALGGME